MKKFSNELKKVDKDNIYRIPNSLLNLYDSWKLHPQDPRILVGKLPKVIMDEIDIMLDKAREHKENSLSFLKTEQNYGTLGNEFQIYLNTNLFNDSFFYDYMLYMAAFYVTGGEVRKIQGRSNDQSEFIQYNQKMIDWCKKHKKFKKWTKMLEDKSGKNIYQLNEMEWEIAKTGVPLPMVGMSRDKGRQDIYAAWFNFAYKGDYNPIHKHSSDISTVIYVKDEEGTPTSFTQNNIYFEGKPGDILMFSGHDVLHGVDEKKTNKERITISVNVDVNWNGLQQYAYV